ncbi:hypothetical protein PLICRDRAFT_119933 [Plicaturopsis crispa FD-325 SS-3]|uniref:Uncharacterized protein n=1 Tax=Plicaturopsis crispa FD-325 SS-3 TaxID=944288 RepID=A0A0C9T1G2_PLICR|nr:hypothetical protein PLICRDRAFT_119933 [Plicaturopsis crispa FD-325 SS-3]
MPLRTSDERTRKPRKPKIGNTIVPSSYRPFVLASDRLRDWNTPYSTSFISQARQFLGGPAYDHMREVALISCEPKTRSGYGAGLLRFTQYCDALGIPEADRMPASELLLAGFASSAAAKVSGGAADTWLAGVHKWHVIHSAPWHGGALLSAVLTGVEKCTPATSRRELRPPITFEHMQALFAGLNLKNTRDAAVWAVASVAYWACCRYDHHLVLVHLML